MRTKRVMSIRAATMALLACVAVVGCADAVQSTQLEGPRTADLDALDTWIGMERSWPVDAQDQARTEVQRLRELDGELTDAQFFLEVAAVVALADNGHSNVSMNPAYAFWGMLPIRIFDFDDGLYVVRATTENARLLGARIEAIAGRPVDEVIEVMGRYHGGTEVFLRAHFANPLLLTPALLHAADLTDSAVGVEITFTMQDGTSEAVSLATYETEGRHPGARPWAYLSPHPFPAENGEWVSASSEVELPWAQLDGAENFRYRYLPEQGVAHIQLRQNIGRDGDRIRDFVKDVESRLKEDRPRHIILDNRQNGGGDLTRTADFALELPSLIPDDGRVFSLISGVTFSAGIYTSFFPKAADPARTLVVGTRVGDRERFWAETDDAFILPGLGIRINYSLETHDLGAGCSEDRCHLRRRRKWNVSVGSLEPDVLVPTTFADFAAGRDPQVEYVLRTIARTP